MSTIKCTQATCGQPAPHYHDIGEPRPETPTPDPLKAITDILNERARQPEIGWTAEHDDSHGYGHLIRLAEDRLKRAYTEGAAGPLAEDDKARVQLVKAAALIMAAIDLIDRHEED